jgi:murein DD-endopeptidase MepM/ murein hydrolase activator NlpD
MLNRSNFLASTKRRTSSAKPELGGVVYTVFLLIVALSIIGVGVVAFTKLTYTNPLSPNFLEDTPPTLSWHEVPRGLGAEAASIGLTASDNSSGLDEVVVRVSQNNQPIELVRKSFQAGGVLNETVEFKVDSRELGLKEGNAELQVLAFDKALWNNGARLSAIVEVNFSKPQIMALSPQQNGVLGGTEMVFYKVTGKPPEAHGVLSQGTLYDGFSAGGWNDGFKSRPSVYIALYPIPASFDDSKDQMRVTARDNLGNSATSSFNYRIKQRRWSSFRTNLSQQRGRELKEAFMGYANREKLSFKESGDLAADLKSLVKILALSDEGFIGTALAETASKKLWREAFLTPVSATPTNSSGDQRVVFLDDKELLRGTSSGVRFPVSKRTPVVASNAGTVVFIGTLGLLGNTVVIDHGFGLSTVYGHLSNVSTQRGVTVQRGQEIGSTGNTGLAQSEEVYFETRVHGVPVSPNEWWDQSWVTDHIDNKVNFILRDAT